MDTVRALVHFFVLVFIVGRINFMDAKSQGVKLIHSPNQAMTCTIKASNDTHYLIATDDYFGGTDWRTNFQRKLMFLDTAENGTHWSIEPTSIDAGMVKIRNVYYDEYATSAVERYVAWQSSVVTFREFSDCESHFAWIIEEGPNGFVYLRHNKTVRYLYDMYTYPELAEFVEGKETQLFEINCDA